MGNIRCSMSLGIRVRMLIAAISSECLYLTMEHGSHHQEGCLEH